MENTQIERPKTSRYTPEQIAIMHEILDLAVNCPKGIAEVFVNFSPHVNALAVNAHIEKWTDGSSPDFDRIAYTDSEAGTPLSELRNELCEFIRIAPTLVPLMEDRRRVQEIERLRTAAESLGMAVVPKGSHND